MPVQLENLTSFEPIAFEIVSHFLMFGVGAHVAGFVYFLLSKHRVSPRYRMATYMSCVIMVTAAMMLARLAINWQSAFTLDAETMRFVQGDTVFSNGFRYINWIITIPLLITQVLIVCGLAGSRLAGTATKLTLAAMGMIVTGYVGQFFETTNTTALLVWGTISTVFYVYLLVVVLGEIGRALPTMPPQAARIMSAVRVLFVVSWSLYPGGYLLPLLAETIGGQAAVVGRQITFTVADVTSKVVYGILLSRAAQFISASEGYEPAFVVLDGAAAPAGTHPAVHQPTA